ncbi:phosphotransferase enzyme family protein [Streptomyces luteireticuli]|uniref:phosphotransferase enzyme family protein n=1 Tax=Streptomyces luteireticuli TaxID=173858 RepID=UPI003555F34D
MTEVPAAIELARREFGIPAGVGQLLGGGATANILVRLSNSARTRTWVLRCPLRDPRPARLRFLLAFQRAARAKNVLVPLSWPTADGRPWARDSDGRPWVLLTDLPGRPLTTVTALLAEQAGAQLAALHRLPRKLGNVPAVGPDSLWHAWVTHPNATWRTVAEVLGDDHRLLNPYRLYVGLLDRYAEPLHGLSSASTAWTHGDFHGHNILHNRRGITGLIDLDGIGRRPRIWDLATAVLMLARTGSGDYRLQPHLARAILSGYEQHTATPLTDIERAALWPSMLLSQLPDPHHLAALRTTERPLTPALMRPLAALTALRHQHTYLTRILTTERTR